MGRILIKGVAILSMTGADQPIIHGDIAIEDNRLVAVGQVENNWQAEKVINGTGKLAMPGFVNCHTHAAMTLLRSYADDLPLMRWLNDKIWPLEDNLIAEDIYWGTMLSIVEMIKSGTTSFIDMYFFMEEVAKAVEETGIRAVLSRGMIGMAPNAETAIQESEAMVKTWHGAANGRITTMFGPHAPYTCPPEYIQRVCALADRYDVGVHIHLAETRTEVEDINNQYGKSPIQLMNELGVFDRHVVAAHCVHLDQEDLQILKDKEVGVAHNPESNMKLASGVAPVPAMLSLGINVGIGTDGASSNNNLDMLQETRTAALLHKVTTGDPTVVPAYRALEMATVNGARVLGLKDVGSLTVGAIADLILIDLEQPHLYPKHDIVANVVYSAQASDVDTVIIDGKVVMEGRKLTFIDEKRVLAEVGRVTANLLQRSQAK